MASASPVSVVSPMVHGRGSRKRPAAALLASTEDRVDFSQLKACGVSFDDSISAVHLQPIATFGIESVAGISIPGYNPIFTEKPNQDAFIMFEDAKTGSVVVACLDGHGVNGHIISQFFKQEIASRLPNHPLFATNIQAAVSEVLFILEYELYCKEQRVADFSGTTLTLAVIRNGKIIVANIGDSRIIIARQASAGADDDDDERVPSRDNSIDLEFDEHEPSPKRLCRELQAKSLTTDHKPDCPMEYERILSAGGRVFSVQYQDGSVGPPRVWLGNMNVPGLAMSRSLGDFIVHTAGVISKPDFTEYTLKPNEDVFLIAATDGLWDHVSNEDAMNIIASADRDALKAVQLLCKESRSRWLSKERVVDDTTICIAHFRHSNQS